MAQLCLTRLNFQSQRGEPPGCWLAGCSESLCSSFSGIVLPFEEGVMQRNILKIYRLLSELQFVCGEAF